MAVPVPAIIDPETWERAQGQLRQNQERAQRHTTPVWSKYPNASCYRYLQAILGQVEPTRTAITVNVKQHLYQPIGNRFSVLPIAQNALVIGKGKYGQTLRCVLVPDGECERFRAFIIAVSGEQDDLLPLADLPHFTIRGIRLQSEVREGYLLTGCEF
jgi:hypothetical protein